MYLYTYLYIFSQVSLLLLSFFGSQNLYQGHSIMVRFLITKELPHY